MGAAQAGEDGPEQQGGCEDKGKKLFRFIRKDIPEGFFLYDQVKKEAQESEAREHQHDDPFVVRDAGIGAPLEKRKHAQPEAGGEGHAVSVN